MDNIGNKVEKMIYGIGILLGLYIYKQTDRLILSVIVIMIFVIIGRKVKRTIQSKNRENAKNAMRAYSGAEDFQELIKMAGAPSRHLSKLYAQGVKVVFTGRWEEDKSKKTTGIITPDFCYVKICNRKKTKAEEDAGVDFVEAKNLSGDVQVRIEKYEYQISSHTEMDVESAALIGNALGGTGAAISAAAHAAKVNSEGGKLVHQTMKAYNVILSTPGQESILEGLYLADGKKLTKVEIPCTIRKKATARDIVSRLNTVLSSLNK